jgi:integrase/recombinase XerD
VQEHPAFQLERALLPGGAGARWVIVDMDGRLHGPASAWLGFLADSGRSPNTVRSYGSKVAWYLAWTAQTADWRTVRVAHIAMWQNTLFTTPVLTGSGATRSRSRGTVRLWTTAVRSFYEWADAQGLLLNDVAARLTQLKYFAPGTPAGGEYGARRRVLADELRFGSDDEDGDPQWIDDAGARNRLEELPLRARDRFIVDLFCYTGVRAGEALSLFKADMHFGGGSRELGCRVVDPHLHVRLDNPVENGARAKGAARVIYAGEHLVERYVDYLLERARLLGTDDMSPHVLVNLYAHGEHRARAMTYSGVRKLIVRCGERIGFSLQGPHTLRHTVATRMVRGIDCDPQPLDVVQVLLGHRSISSTRIYTHDLEAAKKAALLSLAPRSASLVAGS